MIINEHNLVVLDDTTAEQLYHCLRREYMSYEFYPLIIELLEVLSKKFHPDRKNER